MRVRKTIKDIYQEIRKCLFEMIPENWESIYLYASVIQLENSETKGELYFYYFPKSIIKKNPINVYQIPQKFNLNEYEYIKLTNKLYELVKALRYQNIRYDKLDWTNITISIENVEFLVEFNCDNILNSNYTQEDRMNIWQYKYLDFPIEKFTKKDRKKIKEFLREESLGLHEVKTYSETFYQNHEHNNIGYSVTRKEDQYVKESDDNRYTIKTEDQYQIKKSSRFFNLLGDEFSDSKNIRIEETNGINNVAKQNNYNINRQINNKTDKYKRYEMNSIKINDYDNEKNNNYDLEVHIRNQILKYK